LGSVYQDARPAPSAIPTTAEQADAAPYVYASPTGAVARICR